MLLEWSEAKQERLWKMPFPFPLSLLVVVLSEVPFKAANLVSDLHFCRFVHHRYMAAFSFIVLLSLVKSYPCCLSRIVHFFLFSFVLSQAIHAVVQLQFFTY